LRETIKPHSPPGLRRARSRADDGVRAPRVRCHRAATRDKRRHPIVRDDEDTLTKAIIRLATAYGRYGYRRIRALLQAEGFSVNFKRVYRIWRREWLKVPQKQPRRGRLWLSDGSCIRLRAEREGHA
jgi:putative transposase